MTRGCLLRAARLDCINHHGPISCLHIEVDSKPATDAAKPLQLQHCAPPCSAFWHGSLPGIWCPRLCDQDLLCCAILHHYRRVPRDPESCCMRPTPSNARWCREQGLERKRESSSVESERAHHPHDAQKQPSKPHSCW